MIDWCAVFAPALRALADPHSRSSHGNSEKKHERQVLVAEDVARQLGEKATAENIIGVMIESHLVAGSSPPPSSRGPR